MSQEDALARLLGILHGLGFHVSQAKTNNPAAQRKLCSKPDKHQWLTVVVWTTVTAEGTLPGKELPVQVLLFGNSLKDHLVWKFSGTKRYRKNPHVFQKRLRKRAELATQLAESVVYCPRHKGPLTLKVLGGQLSWSCCQPGCGFYSPLDFKLSWEVRKHTPAGFWQKRSH